MEIEQYSQIKIQVQRLLNIDLNHYKSEQMCRRLDSWLIRSSGQNWEAYFQRLQNDSRELSKFREYLTINVSEFFRDIDRWQILANQILPELYREAQAGRPARGLRIWSAGCAAGQEPYSLAMLLDENFPGARHAILATDLDRGALQKAQARGPYTSEELRSISEERRIQYFEAGGPPFFVKEQVGRFITFGEQNLLSDPFENNFDLIVCRNVIIYFTSEAKMGLYQRFQAALRPGGSLFLGGTEIISKPAEIGFHGQAISFYKKV